MKKTIKRLFSLCLAALLLFALPVWSEEAGIPSLFAGNEAWYKDAISPLIFRNDKYFVPAELCSMFDYVSVTTPRENNLLLHNTLSGDYISILFKQRSAVINGVIEENIYLFRDGGTYYVDADTVARALGLTVETHTTPDDKVILRLSDENSIFTLEELLASYFPQDDTVLDGEEELPVKNEPHSFNGKLKRIYVICQSPPHEYTPFPAKDSCDRYGVNYTHFLSENDSVEALLQASVSGVYGLSVEDGSEESLKALGDSLAVYTGKRARYTLSTGNKETDKALREAGYIPISPNFTVNGSSRPDSLLVDIINYIGKHGSCTLYLEDCWNSERMAILLSELENSLYCTANLAEYSFKNE